MSFIKRLLLKYFSYENAVRSDEIRGEIPPIKEVYQYASRIIWPCATESVLVGFVSMIDTIMVGGIGPEAIAAVGITTQPKYIFLALIISLDVGVTTIVARRRGENDIDGANRCLRQAIVLATGISLILTILGIVFAKELVIFSGANEDTADLAATYLKIIMMGFLFMSLSLTINAAQKGVGNTKISMKTNVVANIINLIFNYFLIDGRMGFPKMGVAGAATATTLGFIIVAFFMSVHSIVGGNGFLNISKGDDWKFDKNTLLGLKNISLSAVVEQLFMRMGFFIYAKLVAQLGTIAFAAHQICMNIINVSFTLGDGFNMAVASLVGQSMGAKRPDMAKIYVRSSMKLAKTFSALIAIGYAVLRIQLLELFTDDMRIIAMGESIMFLIAAVTLIQSSALIYSGCRLRGAGDAKYIATIALISIGIVRPLSAWILCYPMGMGLFGAWISLFIDQILRWVLTGIRFKNGKWTEIVV